MTAQDRPLIPHVRTISQSLAWKRKTEKVLILGQIGA
uniref:Uncharacterized protein n=1 Tax=Anguilla anguilla TaxID=7936 RepID=A0A0E9XSG6_ANGAN